MILVILVGIFDALQHTALDDILIVPFLSLLYDKLAFTFSYQLIRLNDILFIILRNTFKHP